MEKKLLKIKVKKCGHAVNPNVRKGELMTR